MSNDFGGILNHLNFRYFIIIKNICAVVMTQIRHVIIWHIIHILFKN